MKLREHLTDDLGGDLVMLRREYSICYLEGLSK